MTNKIMEQDSLKMEFIGRLASIELIVAQGMSMLLSTVDDKQGFVEALKKELRVRLDRIPAPSRQVAVDTTDRILDSALATALRNEE